MSYLDLDFDDPTKYAIPLKKYRKRTQKTTKDQHYAYVTFLEKHPKLWDPSHRKYEQMWNDLTQILNTKGPRKTVELWQTNLRDWRYSVKFKYKKHKKLGKPMGDMEMKLLRMFERCDPDDAAKSKASSSSDEQSPENGNEQQLVLEEDDMSEDPLMEGSMMNEEMEANEDSAMEADSADISSVWFPEVKKEITAETLDDAANKLHVRWTDQNIQYLLGYVKMTIGKFEQPNPQTYYRNFLLRKPPIERSIGDNWRLVQEKMNYLREQYNQTVVLLKEKYGNTASKNLSAGVKAQILLKCPHYFELESIFSKKDHCGQSGASKGKLPGDLRKLSLPSQITVRNFRSNQHTNMTPGPSRTSISTPQTNVTKEPEKSLELEKLDVEIRRFELQKKRYEHEKTMERQKFLFDSEMRKQEMELRMKELENKRLEVENMVQIEKLRLEQEERVERYRIQMQNSPGE